MWSPRRTGGFPPCSPVCYHTETTRTQTSVPTSMINIQVYKFIQITVGHYVHTYTKLRTINKHTYQDQCRIKYLHRYRSTLHYFTSHHATYKQSMNYDKLWTKHEIIQGIK